MNMLSPAGFLFSLGVALRIIRGGFAHFAPVCSTWVWVSRHSTSRSYIHPLGRPGQQIVGEANIMAARVVLLTALLIGRGVWVTIEQPVSSLMRSRVSPSQQLRHPPSPRSFPAEILYKPYLDTPPSPDSRNPTFPEWLQNWSPGRAKGWFKSSWAPSFSLVYILLSIYRWAHTRGTIIASRMHKRYPYISTSARSVCSPARGPVDMDSCSGRGLHE